MEFLPYVTVCFLNGGSNDRLRDFISQLLTSSTYVHVVVRFNRADGSTLTAQVDMKSGVSIKKNKEFKRPGWVFVDVPLAVDSVLKVLAYYRDAERRGARYNQSGLKWTWTPFPSSGNEETYTCSEIIVHAFQSVGLMTDLIPAATSPGDIYEYLQEMRVDDIVVEEEPFEKIVLRAYSTFV